MSLACYCGQRAESGYVHVECLLVTLVTVSDVSRWNMWWRFASECASLNTCDHAMCPLVTRTCHVAVKTHMTDNGDGSGFHSCALLHTCNMALILGIGHVIHRIWECGDTPGHINQSRQRATHPAMKPLHAETRLRLRNQTVPSGRPQLWRRRQFSFALPVQSGWVR